MTQETSRLHISYPSRGQTDYYGAYRDGMDAIDSLLFTGIANENLFVLGGGTVSWVSDQFTFTGAISFITSAFGARQEALPDSLNVPPGYYVYADVDPATSSSGSSVGFVVDSQVPVNPASLALAYHDPVTGLLYFRTGLVLSPGGFVTTGLTPVPGSPWSELLQTVGATTAITTSYPCPATPTRFRVTVTAQCVASGENAVWEYSFMVRTLSGVASVGPAGIQNDFTDASVAWTVTPVVSATSLNVSVTGEAAKTIDWTCTITRVP